MQFGKHPFMRLPFRNTYGSMCHTKMDKRHELEINIVFHDFYKSQTYLKIYMPESLQNTVHMFRVPVVTNNKD